MNELSLVPGIETLEPRAFSMSSADDDLKRPIVISYDNEQSKEGPQNLMKSLKENEWDYKFVGDGEKWEGFISKIRGYYGALEKMHPEKIVILSDARDVLCVRKSHSFIKGFLTYSKPIVVSMEIFCEGKDYFQEGITGRRTCTNLTSYWKHHKMEPPERKFVNSGLIAGYAKEVKHMFGWILENKFTDDQFGVGNYMLNFPDKVAADYDAKLLHTSTFGVNAGVQFIHKQANDSPSLAELNGNRAYFLHIAGNKNKGQRKVYEQVKKILDLGIAKSGVLTSLYGYKEPEFDEVF